MALADGAAASASSQRICCHRESIAPLRRCPGWSALATQPSVRSRRHACAPSIAVVALLHWRQNRRRHELCWRAWLGGGRALACSASEREDVVAPPEVESPVLVTGSSRGIGRAFAEWLTRQGTPVILHGSGATRDAEHPAGGAGLVRAVEVADLRSEAAIKSLVQRLEDLFPAGLGGFAHFASTPLDSAGMAENANEGAAIIDVHMKALVLLAAGLKPLLQRARGGARVLTVSSGAALAVPSSWFHGAGMYALTKCFVEQYTEALAHELRGTSITVCGARIEGTFRTELHELTRSEAARPVSELVPALAAIWQLPSAEAHGRVLPALPKEQLQRGQISGGSVLGASVDCRFALRAAVTSVSDYPANARPEAYASLASALGLESQSLCWFHGSSDAIMRCTTAALGVAPRLGPTTGSKSEVSGRHTALVQQPTWANAPKLLRDSGAQRIMEAPYGNPWLSEDGDASFWEALGAALLAPDPPALVYLVHPHFPTGFHSTDFAERLGHALEQSHSGTTFLVDQCYLGFVEDDAPGDNAALERLALVSDAVVLVRSLSKVEGLAGVRLGYTVASRPTTKHLASGLPFDGGLYVSELDLAGAAAALRAVDAAERRHAVVSFYDEERRWLQEKLESLGLEVTPSVGPFACLRGPENALRKAAQQGGQIMLHDCPALVQLQRKDDGIGIFSSKKASACFLIADRAANQQLVKLLRDLLKAESSSFRLPWL